MQYKFKVDYHPSGRRTLKIRAQEESTFTDCAYPLFSNADIGSFYRAVAAILHRYHAQGDSVDYEDTHLDMSPKKCELRARRKSRRPFSYQLDAR